MRINRLRGQHHKTPFEGTRRRTLLGDVNGLVAENGLHPTKHNRKKLQTLKTRPFFCAPSARTLERATTERPPDAPPPPFCHLRAAAAPGSTSNTDTPRPGPRAAARCGGLSAQLHSGAQPGPKTAGGGGGGGGGGKAPSRRRPSRRARDGTRRLGPAPPRETARGTAGRSGRLPAADGPGCRRRPAPHLAASRAERGSV